MKSCKKNGRDRRRNGRYRPASHWVVVSHWPVMDCTPDWTISTGSRLCYEDPPQIWCINRDGASHRSTLIPLVPESHPRWDGQILDVYVVLLGTARLPGYMVPRSTVHEKEPCLHSASLNGQCLLHALDIQNYRACGLTEVQISTAALRRR